MCEPHHTSLHVATGALTFTTGTNLPVCVSYSSDCFTPGMGYTLTVSTAGPATHIELTATFFAVLPQQFYEPCSTTSTAAFIAHCVRVDGS